MDGLGKSLGLVPLDHSPSMAVLPWLFSEILFHRRRRGTRTIRSPRRNPCAVPQGPHSAVLPIVLGR